MPRSEHLDCLEGVFAKIRFDFGATPVERNGGDHHARFLIEYPPTMAIFGLVHSLKGI